MMLKNASNQRGANNVTSFAPWNTKSQLGMLVASKAGFLENYLADSSWILNECSIECHKKKHQRFRYLVFDLEAGRFKFLVRPKMSFPPLTPFYNV